MPTNFLITGLPRSGTTLLTSLLSDNMEAVTFSEPEWLKEVRNKSGNCDKFSFEFEKKINFLRKDIQNGKPVYIKTSRFNKGLPQNYYRRNEKGEIDVDKDELPIIFPKSYANKPFIIKANAQFTACLSELIKRKNYKIICLIRNPIATIMSWRSLKIPVSYGNLKVAEKYFSNFNLETEAENLLKKQVLILDWFFKQFDDHFNCIDLVEYESLVVDPSSIISNLIEKKINEPIRLKSKNQNKFYDLKEQSTIKTMLLNTGHHYKKYYSI